MVETFDIPSLDSYMYESAYFDYINTKIANEEAIASHLAKYIPVNEAAYSNLRAINEAKLSDKIKASWQRFLNFIKGIFGKFMESCTKILFDEKDYLVKYKDIILNKKPKEIEYSYVGNFREGTQRCIDIKLPVFDWNTHHAACEAKGYGALVKMIAPKMKYDEGNDNLSAQFKEYFFASEDGKVSKGTFADLNFKEMYNFCYNFDKIDQMVKNDTRHLEQSTNAIMEAIKQQIETDTVVDASKGEEKAESGGEPESKEESAIYFREAEEVEKSKKDDAGESKPGSIDIKNSNAISQMGSYDNKDDVSDEQKAKNAEDAKGSTTKNVEEVCMKWQTVCKAMLTAKCTAVQSIANTYMKIIRTHVRSYVGNSKDLKDNRDAAEEDMDYKPTKKPETKDEEKK